MRQKTYRIASVPGGVLAALLLGACGAGGGTSAVDVANAVRAANPSSSRASCKKAGTTTYEDKKQQVYRCTIETDVGIHAMRPQATCFVYVDRRPIDVTRSVGRC
jgi:hypothetical protein